MANHTPIANPALPLPPSGKYPAKAHARRVALSISSSAGGASSSGILYLEGQRTHMTEDDDQARSFRQRRPFYYLTGCDLPDCFFAYDIDSDHSTLWIPPVDPELVTWAGLPLSPEEAKELYDVDEVRTSDELTSGKAMRELLNRRRQRRHDTPTSTPPPTTTTVFVIPDRADLAPFQASDVQSHSINTTHLLPAITACRVVKDAHEIALIRHANVISSYAHTEVLAAVPRASNERELHALFTLHCHANACPTQSYACICASGPHASTLHYVRNDLPLAGKLNLLLDAGAEFRCYCADITRTFPLNGKFTPESKSVYELVLRMQSAAMSMIKAGVRWEDCHMRAHAVAAEGLRELGILRKELSVEQILQSKVTTRFFPHGLGHYLGMDTHDVGGEADYDDPNEFFRYLRVRGKVPSGAVITNEPGIYFRRFPLEQELGEGKWKGVVDESVLARYWDIGGVRIEDDIWVKEDGYENLTTVESGWQYIEAAVSGHVP